LPAGFEPLKKLFGFGRATPPPEKGPRPAPQPFRSAAENCPEKQPGGSSAVPCPRFFAGPQVGARPPPFAPPPLK